MPLNGCILLRLGMCWLSKVTVLYRYHDILKYSSKQQFLDMFYSSSEQKDYTAFSYKDTFKVVQNTGLQKAAVNVLASELYALDSFLFLS